MIKQQSNFQSLIVAKFMATVIVKKIYPEGDKLRYYIEAKVTESSGNYPPFCELKLLQGKRKGETILKFQTWDYTNDHENRKVVWKLAGRKGHLSKVFPISANKAWIDFKKLGRPNDIGLILFDECLNSREFQVIKIFIVEGGRNDFGLIQMFRDADFS